MGKYTAATADKHKLYEEAVQCVEADIDFVEKTFKKQTGQRLKLIREDFCGTFAAAVEFVGRRKANRAIAVDIDRSVQEWGIENNLPLIKGREKDVTIITDSVLEVKEPKVEAVLAMNFSYFLFKTREELCEYFRGVRESLLPGGILVMDAYGGSESQVPQKEKKKCKGFTYVWDQASFNPVTHEVVNHIHFKFPDGTRMKKAFTYDWRLWGLPEICELLREAGFKRADVYWEGWDEEKGEGDGKFRKVTEAENCETWITYIVGSV